MVFLFVVVAMFYPHQCVNTLNHTQNNKFQHKISKKRNVMKEEEDEEKKKNRNLFHLHTKILLYPKHLITQEI